MTKGFDVQMQREKSGKVKNLAYAVESFVVDYFCSEELCDDTFNFFAMCRTSNGVFDSNSVSDFERRVVATKIRPVLSCLGIPESIKGFRLLSLAVLECVNLTLEGLPYKMSDVYLTCASKYGTSKSRCERLCRYACTYARASGDFLVKYPSLSELSQRTVEGITVKELCDTLVWYLIRECKIRI